MQVRRRPREGGGGGRAVCGAAPRAAFAQDDTPQVKVGVLPFVDATGTGSAGTGAAIGRRRPGRNRPFDRAARPRPRAPKGPTPRTSTSKRRPRSARPQRRSVLIGTVLEARSEAIEQGRQHGPPVRPERRRDLHKSKATVELQGDLVNVSTGRRIASLRVKGEDSDTKVGASAWTNLGGLSTDTTRGSSRRSAGRCRKRSRTW